MHARPLFVKATWFCRNPAAIKATEHRSVSGRICGKAHNPRYRHTRRSGYNCSRIAVETEAAHLLPSRQVGYEEPSPKQARLSRSGMLSRSVGHPFQS